MTVTQWRTPDDQAMLIYITNNGGSIEDIHVKFKDAEPVRVVAEGCHDHELDHDTAQAFADLLMLCV